MEHRERTLQCPLKTQGIFPGGDDSWRSWRKVPSWLWAETQDGHSEREWAQSKHTYIGYLFLKSHPQSNKELPCNRVCQPLILSLCSFLLFGPKTRSKVGSLRRGLSSVFIPEQEISTSSLQRSRDMRIGFAAPSPQTTKLCASGHFYGDRIHDSH